MAIISNIREEYSAFDCLRKLAAALATFFCFAFVTAAAAQFPLYDFAGHKGYGTKSHIASIKEYGPCPQHRMTFEPLLSMYNGRFPTDKSNA